MRGFLKKHLLNAIMFLVLIVGVAVVAYPTVSDYINSKFQTRAVNNYKQTVEKMPSEEIQKIKVAAQLYNQALYKKQSTGTDTAAKFNYDELLNPNGNGLMAYIIIPSIDVDLPIYHGTEERVLTSAIGHMEESSLPVGGENTRAVVLGHRGLPSMRLFSDLDQLTVDDYFEIHVLNDVLYYKVYDIEIVEPEKLADIRIEKGKDLFTLVTCTPYGINTHRLLIHGIRIESSEKDHLLSGDAVRVNVIYVAVGIGLFLWTITISLIVYLSTRRRKNKISQNELIRRRDILNKYRRRRG